MNEFRVFLAVVIFFISTYLVFDLFANGFDWIVLVFALVGYILIHYIWPKDKESESVWYDLLEYVVDLPFRTMAYMIRLLGRIVRGSDGDIGIDL
ncbi:hypothetical protein [Psychromonas aquimarina]|uniref:hypothetical protein n=1 Tax=Psychromonas aquimarina TaxID=444919 RepID=UPI00048A8AF1|nr:hypothetical protein [Psychromonas aquimarina]